MEGLFVSVTSKSLSALAVARRIDAFLHSTFREATLGQLTEEAVAEHALAIEKRLLEPPKRLAAEADRWWAQIRDGGRDWTYRTRLVHQLRRVRPSHVLAMYKRLLTCERSSHLSSLVYGANHPMGDAAAKTPARPLGIVIDAAAYDQLALWTQEDTLRRRRAQQWARRAATAVVVVGASAAAIAALLGGGAQSRRARIRL